MLPLPGDEVLDEDERDDELDALHRRVRKLADRVHELETRESVNSLVTDTNAIVLRRLM